MKALFGSKNKAQRGSRMVLRPRQRMSQRMVYVASTAFIIIATLSLVTYFQFVKVALVHAAPASGDYRTTASGNWNSTGTWQKYNGTSWIAAVATPTSADGVIEILSGHTVTVTAGVTADQLIVDAGGTLIINSSKTLTIAHGTDTDLNVTGTVQVNDNALVAENSGAVVAFNANSVFVLNWTSTALVAGVIPTATWDAASTVNIIGVTSIVGNTIFGQDQNLGNVIYNCPNQTGIFNLYYTFMSTDIVGDVHLQGNFTVISTGTGSLQIGTVTASNQVINGNFTIQGGILTTTSSGNRVLNVGGNFSMTGGTWHFTDGGGNYTLNVAGNYSFTGGTIDKSSTGACSIVFNGSGTQTHSSGGTYSTAVNFTVNSGAILDMGTSILSGSGTFTLSSGAGLNIGSTKGITTSGANGNIQVTGTRSFSTGANYTYNGSSAQNTGNGLPATVHNITINDTANVTLTANVSVSNLLTLTNGNLNTGTDSVTVTNTATTSIAGYSDSSYVVGNLRRNISATASYDYPVGIATYYELINVTTASLTGVTAITASFTASSPGTCPTGLTHNGKPVSTLLNHGYWTLSPTGILTSGTYGVVAYGTGATNASSTDSSNYTLLKRHDATYAWDTTGTENLTLNIVNLLAKINKKNTGTQIGTKRTGYNTFSNFSQGSGGGGTLPIELLSFTAKFNSNHVDLNWTTATEINNDYFTIERSQDGTNFEEVLRKPGAGSSTTEINYTAIDDAPLNGISYYRLKQTDYDGKFVTFPAKAVKNGVDKSQSNIDIETIGPNPFNDNFNLNYRVATAGNVEVQILNNSGVLVYKEIVTADKGFNSYSFNDRSGLSSGIYFVNVIAGGEMVTKKMVKK